MAKLPADTILDATLVLEPLFSTVLVVSEIFSAASPLAEAEAFACTFMDNLVFSALALALALTSGSSSVEAPYIFCVALPSNFPFLSFWMLSAAVP